MDTVTGNQRLVVRCSLSEDCPYRASNCSPRRCVRASRRSGRVVRQGGTQDKNTARKLVTGMALAGPAMLIVPGAGLGRPRSRIGGKTPYLDRERFLETVRFIMYGHGS